MRIGILTSSRADFGIYLPLLKKLKKDSFFKLKIIAFGTHLSSFYGETIKNIEENGFKVSYTINSMLLNDTPEAIASAMGLTFIKFGEFWKQKSKDFDLILCLGDRYEMFSAVMAGVPFQIPFAHLHGGEKTSGAIDNILRDTITLASKYHFVSTNSSLERVSQLIESDKNIYNVGALSLDNISELKLLTITEFKKKWNIDLSNKTILTTFHPETIAYTKNQKFVTELIAAISDLKDYQVLITMPNADTTGMSIRREFIKNFSGNSRITLIENLGTQSYFTALKYASFLLGNTSSGIIEAASFGKYVINLGDRQKGRVAGENVIHVAVNAKEILNVVSKIEKSKSLQNKNIYFQGGAADRIIENLKHLLL
jgi:GDP/UDP-N,N'-diacetylbacillosamine 2-epimerase (hydrolysing)